MRTTAAPDLEPAAAWFGDRLPAVANAPRAQPAMVERSARLGVMAPLLRRDEAETYRVLEGEVVFFVGQDVVWAAAGDVVVAPAGVERTFRVDSPGGARWFVVPHVRSLERFPDFGRAVSRPHADPAAGWPSEHERSAVASIAAANGIELLGPPGALPGRC